jgi:hypothetical protein
MVTVKTYTREVRRLFTKDEVASLLKEAHNYCKANLKVTYHTIGRKRPRNVLTVPREQYQACIRDYIAKKIQERLPK